MRIREIWNSSQKPTVSFELFPARSEKAAECLDKAVNELAALQPDFVAVTFGAGGSTREGSRQLVDRLKREKGIEVIAYLAGYGLAPDDIAAVLDDYKKMGVENILVVGGDPPREEVLSPIRTACPTQPTSWHSYCRATTSAREWPGTRRPC